MSKKTIIIAEAGVNHNGSLKMAKRLVNAAKDAGVDFIKFQSFVSSNLVVKNSPKAKYQKKIKLSQYEMLKKYELKKSDYSAYKSICSYEIIIFCSQTVGYEALARRKKGEDAAAAVLSVLENF